MTTAALQNPHWQLERRAGEARVNLIRTIAITVFFGQHALRYLFANHAGGISPEFHQQVTSITIFWGLGALGVYITLQRLPNAGWLSWASITWDVLGVTSLLLAAASPSSVYASFYLLVIASAPLRVSLRLVYFATAAAILGYLAYVAGYAWVLVGAERYYDDPAVRIPRPQQLVTILTMIVAGLLAGQIVRQFRRSLNSLRTTA